MPTEWSFTSVFLKKDLERRYLDAIRYGVQKGLPTGNDRSKQQIEEALSIKPGDGNRGRPKKVSDSI